MEKIQVLGLEIQNNFNASGSHMVVVEIDSITVVGENP
jgi:hypothetical protein